MGELDKPEARARMLKHFDTPFAEHGGRWNDMWHDADFLPWDKGRPNPALDDALKDRTDVIPPPIGPDGSRRRALVPGCGRGYDVLLLAALGYDTCGLEIAPEALKACGVFADAQWSTYVADNASRAAPHGPGSFRFFNGDFFKDDWQEVVDAPEGFDLVYDYTFLSALPPEARPAWAKRHAELLKSQNSSLVTVEWPTYKEPGSGGPPWGLRPDVYLAHLSKPGETVAYKNNYPDEDSYTPLHKDSAGKGLVRVAHWQPERTHEIGAGTDWVGVWKCTNPKT